MKRIFLVRLESLHCVGGRSYPLRFRFEAVANTAAGAIKRAMIQARRVHTYRGPYIVTKLKHRGAAV